MPGAKWLESEIQFLKDKFEILSSEDIAIALNKTQKAIWHKMSQLKLKKRLPQIGDIKYNRVALDISIKKCGRQNKTMIKVLCACKKEKYITTTDFSMGKAIYCNYCKDMTGDIEKRMQNRHSDNYKRIYAIYKGIKNRCYNNNSIGYQYYGGKNIKMCDEWYNDFSKFYNWSISNNYSIDYTLDRIDISQNYSPENCRWADKYTQANNKSDNVKVYIFGETKTLAEWSRDDRCKVSYSVLQSRIKKGINPELAMTKAPRKNKYSLHALYLFIRDKHPDILTQFWQENNIK